MEDEGDFSERAKKTIGTLLESLEPSRISDPLWSLTDGLVGNRQWRRDQDFTSCRDSNTCSSSFDDFISHARENSTKYLDNYFPEFVNGSDDDDDDGDSGMDDWDVGAPTGLDSNLDLEEEHTYDKFAIGRENGDDQYYMRGITGNQTSHFGSLDKLGNTFGCKKRDPRANNNTVEAAAQAEELYKGEQASKAEKYSFATAEDNDKVKPILKRKEQKSTSRQSKHVRFKQ